MIVVDTIDIGPFEKLATTRRGETAFYLTPQDVRQASLKPTTEAWSSTGEWLPVFGEKNGRMTMYIAGVPGAGKSYYARKMVDLFPPDYHVILFSDIKGPDSNFAGLKNFWKIDLSTEDSLEKLEKFTLEFIRERSRNAILIFDDVDKITSQPKRKAVYALMENAIVNGRNHETHNGEGDIHVIFTNHTLNNSWQTKTAIENCEYVVLFPQSTLHSQLKLILKKLGAEVLLDEIYKKGKSGEVRAVVIKKTFPQYIIEDTLIKLL